MSEVVFVLGAGASRTAGAPLMNDFIDVASKFCTENQRELGEYKNDFDKILKVRALLQRAQSKAKLGIHNIEEIFAAIEMADLINATFLIPDIGQLQKSIKRFIYKTLEICMKFQVRDGRLVPSADYSGFAHLLRRMEDQRNKKAAVITFNYDLALDFAMIPPRGPEVDYCLSDNLAGNTRVLKLHGSLNWGKCGGCGVVPWSMSSFLSEAFPIGPGVRGPYGIALPSEMSRSGFVCPVCRAKVKSEPVIIPPTWNKIQHHEELKKVWNHAAKELAEAEEIFVIGYSLPASDSFFKFLYALSTVSEKILRKFWVFNPDRDVEQRFRDQLGQQALTRFKFSEYDFSNAIELISEEFAIK